MSALGYAKPGVEATAVPLLIRRSGNADLGALVLAVACLWIAAAIRGALAGNPAVVPGLGSSGAYWAGAVGAALALLGLHCIVRRQTLMIERGTLLVTARSFLGGHTWCEPLAHYPEIRGHVEQRPHRYGWRTWHVVQLWHPEPAKRVELARARDPAALEARARDFGRRFGLPLVWERPRSTIVSPAGVHAADHHAQGGSRDEITAAAVPGHPLSAS